MIKDILKNYDEAYCYDGLTKIYNRQIIEDYCKKLIEQNIPFTLAIIDIDNFKFVNDSYGHIKGDEILIKVANCLRDSLNDKGVIGRFGGDEFIAVIDTVEYDDLWHVLHDLVFGVNKIKFKDIQSLLISVTVGAARFPLNDTNYDLLFKYADKALYRGKMKGRNCFIIYLPEKHANIDLKTKNDKTFSSMYLHSKVFNYLTQDNLFDGIKALFNHIVDYLMVDHICINSDTIKFESKHKLCTYNYEVLENKLIDDSTDFGGLCYINFVDCQSNLIALKNALLKQDIHACCFVKIEAYGKDYGYLRVDSSAGNGRIWQSSELDLFITIAKTIGIILALTNQEL